MTIRAALPADIPLLIEIEVAASEMFRSVGIDPVVDDDPWSFEELTPYVRDGRAFVSVDAADAPVAYILIDVVDGAAHIEQVSVHPAHARKRIGRALIERVDSCARTRGLRALTLTTYADVPWNGPYYERLGFRRLKTDEETPGLRAIRRRERWLELDAWPRTSMTRSLGRDSRYGPGER